MSQPMSRSEAGRRGGQVTHEQQYHAPGESYEEMIARQSNIDPKQAKETLEEEDAAGAALESQMQERQIDESEEYRPPSGASEGVDEVPVEPGDDEHDEVAEAEESQIENDVSLQVLDEARGEAASLKQTT
ncbi:unnamed protein product [Phaeothamnion confervicola]